MASSLLRLNLWESVPTARPCASGSGARCPFILCFLRTNSRAIGLRQRPPLACLFQGVIPFRFRSSTDSSNRRLQRFRAGDFAPRDESLVEHVLSYGESGAGLRQPSNQLGVRARPGGQPFEQIEDQSLIHPWIMGLAPIAVLFESGAQRARHAKGRAGLDLGRLSSSQRSKAEKSGRCQTLICLTSLNKQKP